MRADLVGDTIEFLIELSGTRVEARHLTHGVVVADVLHDTPRLQFRYPADIRAAKRAPLLFDGQGSLLVVDPEGRARRELQRRRLDRLVPGVEPMATSAEDWLDSGSLVARASGALGGLGFFVAADRSIWTFVDGQPLIVRRGEHWTAFPLELAAAIEEMTGVVAVAALVARAAIMISAQPRGAILAVVDDPASLEGVVSVKDRYDLRNDIDPTAMRPETRLRHLIDAKDLDEHTLVRLAALDGATVLDPTVVSSPTAPSSRAPTVNMKAHARQQRGLCRRRRWLCSRCPSTATSRSSGPGPRWRRCSDAPRDH